MPPPRLVREDAQTRKGKGSLGMASLHPSYLSYSSRPLWRRILLSLGVGERRRGGYAKPSASTPMRHRGRITDETGAVVQVRTMEATNFSYPLGHPWAAPGFRITIRRESKPTVPSLSGNVTVIRGGSGANPAAFAGCDDWGFGSAFR
jgi:hypothetical protein